MRRAHFTALRPVCPRCRLADRSAELRLDRVLEEEPTGEVLTGILHCDSPECRLEFPIIDGIPIIVPDVAAFLASSAGQVLRRHDLPEALVSLIGDALGPGSEFDTTRQQLSIYCAAHFGTCPDTSSVATGGGNLISAIAPLLGQLPRTPLAVDLGCSVGGATFALAAHNGGLTLGVDLNFAMLQVARDALRNGRVCFDERRVGLVYQRRELPVCVESAVDFWACDVLALPFTPGLFHTALALNVLDCVPAPRQLLGEIKRLLANSGMAVVASPYDWSPQATPPAAWIGGHSQRAPSGGSSTELLRGLLRADGGQDAVGSLHIERDFGDLQWTLRLHDRATMHYTSDVLMLRRT